MHNMIWATASSGMAGSGLPWQGWEAYTSGSQIEKKFQNFSALNSFFDDIDFETHKYTPSVDEQEELIDKGGAVRINESMDLEIFVMANDNSPIGEPSDRGFGWVHHRLGNWPIRVTPRLVPDDLSTPNVNEAYYVFDPVLTTQLLTPIIGGTYDYKLSGFKTGNYLIDVYNTHTGSILYSSSNINEIHSSLTNILHLGIPIITLYNDNNYEQLDYSFKFWHSSVNGNDLRIVPLKDSLSDMTNSIVLPGNDGNYKKYFLASMVPNPSSENISFTASGENINSVYITDLGGNLIYFESSINLQRFDVNILDLASGAYFVNIKSYSGITKIFKLIKI